MLVILLQQVLLKLLDHSCCQVGPGVDAQGVGQSSQVSRQWALLEPIGRMTMLGFGLLSCALLTDFAL